MNWQPIATAPKDGSRVLAYTPVEITICWWSDLEQDAPDQPGHNPGWWNYWGETWPGRSREHGFGGADHYISAPQNQPSHWQPLPAPPEAET